MCHSCAGHPGAEVTRHEERMDGDRYRWRWTRPSAERVTGSPASLDTVVLNKDTGALGAEPRTPERLPFPCLNVAPQLQQRR